MNENDAAVVIAALIATVRLTQIVLAHRRAQTTAARNAAKKETSDAPR